MAQSGLTIGLDFDVEFNQQLANLAKASARRVAKDAMTPGLNLIAKKAKSDAPGEDKHRIRKLIKTAVHWNEGKQKAVGRVFVAEPKDKGGKLIQASTIGGRPIGMDVVANILEFGTPHIPAAKFMRGARDTEGPKAVAMTVSRLDNALQKEFDKRGRKIWK